MRIRTLCKAVLSLSVCFVSSASYASGNELDLAKTLCKIPDATPEQLANHKHSKKDIVVRGSNIGTEYSFTTDSQLIQLEVIELTGRPKRSTFTQTSIEKDISKPELRLVLSSDCQLTHAQRITYENTTALYVESLDENLSPLPGKEWLNPPLPEAPKNNSNSKNLKIAMIDSGVNYTLKEIADALATDDQGNFIGYDFWENDNKPYDSNPARSPFFIQRHGTRTASILIKEAPDTSLVPYRYPRPDMSRMIQLIDHAASHSIRIVGMPLGSNRYKEWLPFATAVEAHPEILFVVSAGNNGRDIDINPVYPAALEYDNILVVTSADDYIRPAERTNYGKISVDYLVPAENIPATDYDGSTVAVSGSSYAVSRVTALAARILQRQPELSVDELKQQIATYSIKGNTGRYVKQGYLADPQADTLQLTITENNTLKTDTKAENLVPLNLVVLDPGWSDDRIRNTIGMANSIYEQCNLELDVKALLRVKNSGHLANLSPGSALQLYRRLDSKLHPESATVYLATDTDMQVKFDAEAFGLANTKNRPWMKNSLWISVTTKDTGHALAHELYHVLANSGRHTDEPGNLMRDRTALDNVTLTQEQCQQAIETATTNALLQ